MEGKGFLQPAAGPVGLPSRAEARFAFSGEAFLYSLGIPPSDRPPSCLRQLQDLSRESDPGLFFTQLLNVGIGLESSGHETIAAQIYSAIQQSLPGILSKIPNGDSLLAAAQEHLLALQGRGSLGSRFEVLQRGFVKEATDYRTLLPMFAGTLAYEGIRAFTLSRLASSSGEAWFQRGWGARFVSGLAGFSAEVPTFALSGRTLHQWSGTEVGSLSHDLWSAGITLGMLKGASFLGTQLSQELQGTAISTTSPWSRMASFGQAALPQITGFAGLMAAKKIEERTGLSPHVEDATAITDTIASMFSMGIGANLGHSFLGKFFEFKFPLQEIPSEGTSPAKAEEAAPRQGIFRSLRRWVSDLSTQWKNQSPAPFLLMGASFLLGKSSSATAARLERFFNQLSPFAQRGAEILDEEVGLPKKYVQDFLLHAEEHLNPEETNRILENVALLHERGVKGLGSGFLPSARDAKFLSTKLSRIQSALSEYDEAYWRASHGLEEIRLAPRLGIDWSQLRPEEADFIARDLLPIIGQEDPRLAGNYQGQSMVEADLGLYTSPTFALRRLVEVKRSSREVYDPAPLEEAKILLQAFRLSLLARQHRLEGLEYVFVASGLAPRFQERMEQVLGLAGVRYLLWTSNEAGRRLLKSSQLEPLATQRAPSPRKTPKNREAAKAPKTAESNLPWTPAMKNFLEPAIPDFSVRHQETVEDFVAQMIKHLRYPAQQALVEKIETVIKKNGIPRAAEISALFEHFKRNRTNTLSRNNILNLVKIVALLGGEALEKTSTDQAMDSDVDPLLEKLRWEKPRIESDLTKALDQLEETLWVAETSLEEQSATLSPTERLGLHDLLSEAIPDHTLRGPSGEDWYLPKVVEIMAQYPEVAWDGKIQKRLKKSLQKQEALLRRLDEEPSAGPATLEEVPDPWQFNADELPALPPEYLLRYPELELTGAEAIRNEAKEFAELGDRLLNRRSRPLLALLALLRQEGSRLGEGGREEIEALRLAALASTESESISEVTDTVYREYEAQLREVLINDLAWMIVGTFPEISEGQARLPEEATIRALQHLISTRALMPELHREWLQSFQDLRSLTPLARFYLRNREQILKTPARILESTPTVLDPFPELDSLLEKGRPGLPGLPHIEERWRLLLTPLFQDPRPNSALSTLQNKIRETSQALDRLLNTGANRDHALAWGEAQIRSQYLVNRRRVLDHLIRKIGLQELLQGFPEFRPEGSAELEPTQGWGPLPEAPPFRLAGFEILHSIDRQLQKPEGARLRRDWEAQLWDFEAPDLIVGPKPLEQVASDLVQRLMQYYFQHRQDLFQAPLRSNRREGSNPPEERLWELDLFNPPSEAVQQSQLLQTAALLRNDPLEYEVNFRLPSRQQGAVMLSAHSLASLRTGKGAFELPGFRFELRNTDIIDTVRVHPELYNMVDLLKLMLSREARVMVQAIQVGDEYLRFHEPIPKALHRELRRAALLCAMGLDPNRVLPTLEKRIRDLYFKNRDEILDHFFDKSPHRLLHLPEFQLVSEADFPQIMDRAVVERGKSLPIFRDFLYVASVMHLTKVPIPLFNSFQRLFSSAPTFRAIMRSCFKFYFENRQEILKHLDFTPSTT